MTVNFNIPAGDAGCYDGNILPHRHKELAHPAISSLAIMAGNQLGNSGWCYLQPSAYGNGHFNQPYTKGSGQGQQFL